MKYRIKAIEDYLEIEPYRIVPHHLVKLLRFSGVSDAAQNCFYLLWEKAIASDDWSVRITKKEIALELNKQKWSILRLLMELEKSGFIIKEKKPGHPSTFLINLPDSAIKELEKEYTV